MNKRIVATDRAPAAVGPYSQGVLTGDLLFTAMQIALDPATGEMVGTDPPGQARRCLENLAAIVAAAGGTLEDVVKTTIYLVDIGAFGEVNRIYGEFFTHDLPARAVLQAAALPKGALVAVEAVARIHS